MKMTDKDAVSKIIELVTTLAQERSQNESDTAIASFVLERPATLNFYVMKSVKDILAYCNRRDFPPPLIYTCAELIMKRLESGVQALEYGLNAPLKAITQDDTKFEFATATAALTGILADTDFDTIKSKLNLYRKVKSL